MKQLTTTLLGIVFFGLAANAQEEKAQMLPPVVFQGTGSVMLRDGSTINEYNNCQTSTAAPAQQ